MTPTVAFLGLTVVLLLALAKRSRRILRALRRTLVECKAELSRMDGAAHLAKLRIHGIGLQNGSLRRSNRTLTAERDDAHMEAARTLRRVWKLQAENAALTISNEDIAAERDDWKRRYEDQLAGTRMVEDMRMREIGELTRELDGQLAGLERQFELETGP